MRSVTLATITVLAAATPAQHAGFPPVPADSQHTFEAAGEPFRFRATAHRWPLRDAADGTVRAHFFHITYERIDAEGHPDPDRPVTFVYNGGPGSASLWLHLGAVGPWRVVLDDEGNAVTPHGRSVPNAHAWLPFTDLVLLDPVGTGYSRPAEGHEQREFSGYREDIESVGDTIAQLLSAMDRWTSPKYLCGESYGTLRSAGLARYLQDRHHAYLSGIVLVSTVLDYGTKRFQPGHDLPYALHLPSFAATAHYHGALPPEHQDRERRPFLAEVEAFALGDYLTGLARGDRLRGEERRALAERLAGYLGLDTDYVLRADLRVDLRRFAKELLRDRGRTVGRLDSRFLGLDRDDAGARYEYDPSMANIDGPFNAAVQEVLSRRLGYRCALPYENLSGAVGRWSFAGHENRHVNAAEDLRRAMAENPHLRVLALGGLYDLATPYFAADYTFTHMGLPEERRRNLEVHTYPSGHMMYIHEPSLARMTEAVRTFYAGNGR